ncbi:hydroxymethylglutaryl-CoA reductase [Flammeovirgaceae bacterium 311]|nr:hydroxymethylglutaryl-CoA reductase [Flammeovirgaceae bacterium 311]
MKSFECLSVKWKGTGFILHPFQLMFFTQFIPEHIIATLYTRGSLQVSLSGFTLSLKNRLMHATLTSVESVTLNGKALPLDIIAINAGNDTTYRASEINEKNPIDFPLRKTLHVEVQKTVSEGDVQEYVIQFVARPFGRLLLKFKDTVKGKDTGPEKLKIPRAEENDYSDSIIEERLKFAEVHAGVKLKQLRQHGIDPESVQGNCENYIGAAQVPIGLAGPILINGEFAKGEFMVPLATTEGTLVASYNRGIKVLNLCGGVTTTVSDDVMQRAPVFTFADARLALKFKHWVEDHFDELQQHSGSSSQYAKLLRVESFLSNNFAFLRFNFRTGDAAGQNMVTKAAYEGCLWLLEHCPYKPEHFFLESNMATDKKPSQINTLLTRGKRVTAEIIFRKEVLEQELRVTAQQLDYHRAVGNIGAMLSGTNNNGLHSVNAIAALFIATGQDVANVAESSACLTHAEVLSNGDLYASITLPSLIVATYGGGTGLATQRECLELMNCYGEGKAKKLAEIVAGVVAAGEISLAAAISSADWVTSHEAFGRNR